MSTPHIARGVRALAAFLVGAAPVERYLAPALADWLMEDDHATGLRARFAVALRHVAPLAFSALFLLSRVERDGVLALLVPPLLAALPGLFVLREAGFLAAQARWLALGAALCIAIAGLPRRTIARLSTFAPLALAGVAAAILASGSQYVRLPIVGLPVALGELEKPLVVLSVFALVGAHGALRLAQALLVLAAAASTVWAWSTQALRADPLLSLHTDGVMRAIADRAGPVGVISVALGVAATALVLLGFARAGRAASPARVLLAMLAVPWALHDGVYAGMFSAAGMALPFVSYGGSAIVGTWAALALLAVLDRVERPRGA